MNTIQLKPGETMAQYRRRVQFDVECMAVASVIRNHPGIGSKDEIAAMTGFDIDLVDRCVTAINHNETKYPRVEWGGARVKSGPWAGKWKLGWFPQDVVAYQKVMEYADYHSSRVEWGVRKSRIYRHIYALGLNTKQAAQVVNVIEDRMQVPVDQLTASEAQTFRKLAKKQAVQVIKNGAV